MIFKTFLPFLLFASSVVSLQIAPYGDYAVEKRELGVAPYSELYTRSEPSLFARENPSAWPQYDQDPDRHLASISAEAAVRHRKAAEEHSATADKYYKAGAALANSGKPQESQRAYELAHGYAQKSNNHSVKARINDYWANHSLPPARTAHEQAERKMHVEGLIDAAHVSKKQAAVSARKARSQGRRITQHVQTLTQPPPPPAHHNPYADYRK